MANLRPCVNGILAAVLSGSIIPIHGALAQEKSPTAERPAAKLPGALPVRSGSSPNAAIKQARPEADDE